ncbi:class I SAM-dependent methyltransferase [Paenibacillus daejeonensis]|uniref:class I SAM-dependent methyltransferase n=1 Tax=Paenibacillus daejeonensis TaxID=135193 RepID=UPI00037CBC51|nr:class I SAM-dependent methyltransferase [Paenibacillus daejeonensis]
MSQADQQKQVWDQLWQADVSYNWDPLSQSIYKKIRESLPEPDTKLVLEAGSGTGKISLRLAEDGADVTLVDYSEPAIVNSQRAFQKSGQSGRFLVADIRDIRLPDNSIDLVWNAGVLEHFTREEKITILQEMARLTKPDGTVLIFTPSARCLPYLAGKYAAEQQGIWMYGVEEPVWSLQEEFTASGITLIEETHIGFSNSLDFLDFIGGSHAVKSWLSQWYASLSDQEREAHAGYLLVSVGRVGAVQPEAPPLSPEVINSSPALSIDRLMQAQLILSSYHSELPNSHYLNAYREAEATYWFPLLRWLDALIKPGVTHLLDVGTAYGTLLLYGVLAGAKGYGLDMTDQYWSHQLERDYGIGWSRCNIESDPIPGTELYDLILFTEILEHMNYNPIPVFQKFHERLREGGSLLISTPWKRHFAPKTVYSDLAELPYYQPGDGFIDAEFKYYTADELLALAEQTGYRTQSLELFNGHLLAWLTKV